MDFQSAMETFAEAWVAANAGQQVSWLPKPRNLHRDITQISSSPARSLCRRHFTPISQIAFYPTEFATPPIQNESVESKQNRPCDIWPSYSDNARV